MKFDFDLQMFADGGIAPQAAAIETTSTPATTSVENTIPQQTTVSRSNDNQSEQHNNEEKSISCGDIKLITDPNTGRKTIQSITNTAANTVQTDDSKLPSLEETQQIEKSQDEQQQTDSPNGLIAKQQSQQQEAVSKAYTDQELLLALQMGNVDESRIPPARAIEYGQYKAKQAMLNQQQSQQVDGTLNGGVTKEQQSQSMDEFYKKIDSIAETKALEELGFTKADLTPDEYGDNDDAEQKINKFKTAQAWHKQNLINEIQQKSLQVQQQQAYQHAIVKSVIDYADAEKQKEPAFDKIDAMMETHYLSMPYQQSQPIATAIAALKNGTISEKQCETLRKYYEDTRVAYYAKANNLDAAKPKKITPPTVEKSGSGAASTPVSIDFSQMRNMSARDRRSFLQNYFNGQKK